MYYLIIPATFCISLPGPDRVIPVHEVWLSAGVITEGIPFRVQGCNEIAAGDRLSRKE